MSETNTGGRYPTRPLHPRFGLEIEGINLGACSAEDIAFVRELWVEHPVLLVRGQLLSERQMMDFSANFGALAQVVRKDIHSRKNPEITLISNLKDQEGVGIGALSNDDLAWHTDQSYQRQPATGAMLYALEFPEGQGDTWWNNTALAWDDLDPTTQAELEGCKGHFAYQLYKGDITEDQRRQEIRTLTPDAIHPTVLTHPRTGQRNLYIDPTQTFALEGLPPERADALLKELKAHVTRGEYTYKHQWELGDVVLWDNARLLHRRDPFDPRQLRLMKRTTIVMNPADFPRPW